MDLSSVIQMGVEAIKNNSNEETSGLDSNLLTKALSTLVGDGEEFDLSSLISGLAGGSLASIASSWLGSGENSPISAESIIALFGDEKIASFASILGLSEGSALDALSDALPAMVDGASSGGSIAENLLSNLGDKDSLMRMASKFF